MSTATTVNLNENRQVEINVIGWVFTGVAIATVALKLFTRRTIVKVLGWDDVFIFFSLALSIIAAAFVSYAVTLGLGRHTAAVLADYGEDRLVLTAYWQILGYPFNIGSFSFPNISIAILINRLLDPNVLRTRLLYGMVTLQVTLATISVIIVFTMCSPTQKLWNSTLEGTCWDANVLNYYSYFLSAYTTMTDIILALVPISVFWKLQMRFSTKLGVCIMMGLTLLSAVVTIVKATYLPLFTDHTDPLFNVVPLVLWGLVEQNVVIVAACVPTLRPFFHRAFKSQKSSSSQSHSHSHSHSAFKLSSKLNLSSKAPRSMKQPASVSELPLSGEDERGHGRKSYEELNNSQTGIWRRLDVSVESDEDAEEGRVAKELKLGSLAESR